MTYGISTALERQYPIHDNHNLLLCCQKRWPKPKKTETPAEMFIAMKVFAYWEVGAAALLAVALLKKRFCDLVATQLIK